MTDWSPAAAGYLTAEDGEQAARRRLRTDGIDDAVMGLAFFCWGIIWLLPMHRLWFIAHIIAVSAGWLRMSLRRRISDPRLGYVKPLGEVNRWTEPVTLKDLGAMALVLGIVVVLLNLDYSWLTRNVDLSWVSKFRRFGGIVLALILTGGPRAENGGDRVRLVLCLSAGAYGAWRWTDMGPGVGAVLTTCGLVQLVDGAWALWRVRGVPLTVETE